MKIKTKYNMKNLLTRLTPESLNYLNEYGKEYPATVNSILEELKNERFFTNCRYITGYDVTRICKLDTFCDAFTE